MWTRRIRKKAVTIWAMRSIHRDRAAARLAVATERATRIAAYPAAWARRRLRVRRIAGAGWSTGGLPTAGQTLRDLGIDDATADRLIAASATGEVPLATFDQNNRVLSGVGPIAHFGDVLVTAEEFRPRARHGLDIVIAHGVVCVKKTYRDRVSFEREVLALDALAGVAGVPRLVAARVRPRVAYQSFLAGCNVGSLMASNGASVSVQYQVGRSFDRSDRWNEDVMAAARDAALRALRASVTPDAIAKVVELVDRIHERGVTIGDVKYGNLLVLDGEPYLCDFDGATVHGPHTWRCTRERARDREKVSYFFDADVLTERAFRAAVADLAREKPDLFYSPIYYGHGYEIAAPGSIELGSGKWHFIRPYLPDLSGKSIVDLGCNNALLPHEMLRAGARRVTAYELNPIFARYARLNHRWFEFVDNRKYPGFELVEGYMHEACDRDWTGYDIATAFCSLYYEEPDEMARIVRTFSATAEWFIAQANENRDEHDGVLRERSSLAFLSELLRANGYPNQRLVEFPYYDRPLVIGRRSPAT